MAEMVLMLDFLGDIIYNDKVAPNMTLDKKWQTMSNILKPYEESNVFNDTLYSFNLGWIDETQDDDEITLLVSLGLIFDLGRDDYVVVLVSW